MDGTVGHDAVPHGSIDEIIVPGAQHSSAALFSLSTRETPLGFSGWALSLLRPFFSTGLVGRPDRR
jgi:hypothetical protein